MHKNGANGRGSRHLRRPKAIIRAEKAMPKREARKGSGDCAPHQEKGRGKKRGLHHQNPCGRGISHKSSTAEVPKTSCLPPYERRMHRTKDGIEPRQSKRGGMHHRQIFLPIHDRNENKKRKEIKSKKKQRRWSSAPSKEGKRAPIPTSHHKRSFLSGARQ